MSRYLFKSAGMSSLYDYNGNRKYLTPTERDVPENSR